MTLNYDKLITSWHDKACDQEYFSKFVFEYLAFIAYLKKKKFTEENSDRDVIQKLKQDDAVKEKYLGEVRNSLQISEWWREIMNELDRDSLVNVSRDHECAEVNKWWNCSSSGPCEPVESSGVAGKINGLNDWVNMVEFWYSVRNNFFHGGKDPNDARDKLFVENGYKTLRPLVEILISSE